MTTQELLLRTKRAKRAMALADTGTKNQIGRASCRERV